MRLFPNKAAALCLLTASVFVPTISRAGDCEKLDVWPTMRACLLLEQSARVDVAYRRLLKKLQHDNVKSAKLLARSQESWEQFVSDSCDFQATMQPDMIAGDARYNCFRAVFDRYESMRDSPLV